MATVAHALPGGRRPGFGRCVIACATAWFTAVVGLVWLLLPARALSERLFGDVDTTSHLGFFSSSVHHPLGLYGLATVAIATAAALRLWLWLQCTTRVAWWAALVVGALAAAGTQMPPSGGGGVSLLLLAAGVTVVGSNPRVRLPAPPRAVVGAAIAAWLLLGALLFVAAGRAVADSPLRIAFDGSGTSEMIGLKQADTPPLWLNLRNRSASPLVVESVRVEIAGAGPPQRLAAGELPSGSFSLPVPITHRFVIAPRSNAAIGASWRSVCHSGPPGARTFTLTLHVALESRSWQQSRKLTYTCVG